MSRKGILLRLIPVVIILGAIVAFFALGLNRYFNVEALRAHESTLRAFVNTRPAVATIAFVIAYAVIVAVSLPGSTVMTLAGGLVFGLWMGAILSIVAATLGAIGLFILARFVAGETLRQRAGPFVARMAEGFKRNAFSYLLFLRLVPLFPFWAVNLVAAVVGMPLRTFALATLIGIVPGTIAFAAIGDGLGLAVGADTEVTPMTIGLRVGFALLAFVPLVVQWIRRKRP